MSQRDKTLESLILEQNLNDRKIEYYCDYIFSDSPIKFIPEKGNPEDECLAKLIRKYRVTIPIIRDPEREKTYFMGTQKYKMEYRYQSIIMKIGNNIERFDLFVPKMQRKI